MRPATVGDGKLGRRAYLDGLRGVAALIVLFSHLTISLLPAIVTFSPNEVHSRYDIAIGNSPLALFWAGNFAVCLFFVLSGFVLSDFCAHSRLSFPATVVRRYLRLAVPILATSTFAWLLMFLGAYMNYEAAVQVTGSGWLSMWYRGFSPDFFDMVWESVYRAFASGHSIYNSNLWTMQIELAGSVYIFMLHGLIRYRPIRIALSCVLIWINNNNFYGLFFAGALLYDLDDALDYLVYKLGRLRPLSDLAFFIVFLFGAFCGSFPHLQPGMSATWHSWLSQSTDPIAWHMVGAVLVMVALLRSHALQYVFQTPPGRYLGRISFVLYLIHIPIVCSVTAGLALLFAGLPYPAIVILCSVGTLALVIPLSGFLATYIDENSTELSRRTGKCIDGWIDRRAA
jgi:peptidoglycan/LPS O-acetylase OafA/YrhL